jgi:hypothetical protein
MSAFVTSFTYCDNIQTEPTPQGQKSNIINPLNVLAPVAIPGNYSFAISCAIAGLKEAEPNTVQIQFVTGSGNVINDTGVISIQMPQKKANQNQPTVLQFNFDLRNLVLPEEGIYTTRVYANGEMIEERKILVIKGELK